MAEAVVVSNSKRALEDFRALNKVAFENQHNFNLNPLNSYILIKKLTKDLEQLIEPSRNKLRYGKNQTSSKFSTISLSLAS